MSDYHLTKTKYCSGVQCPKMLWMMKNKPEEAVDSMNGAVIENGNIVGRAARNYFGEYTLIQYSEDKAQMVSDTINVMESGAENIAEAGFIYDGLYCAVDILHRNSDGWDIVEVKSSTGVKPIHVDDMSFQYYVLKSAGINVKNVYILYINNQYVRHGELDLKQLFRFENYTEKAIEKQDEIKAKIAELREYIKQSEEPDMKIGAFCEKPYLCSFVDYCSAFYNNDMEGSYSIKHVLPALYPDDPELNYHSLDQVHNGSEASEAFLTMADKSSEEIAKLRENLLKYCGLDTYAMVKVLRRLREAVG